MKHVLFNDHQGIKTYIDLQQSLSEYSLIHSCGFQQTFAKDLLLYGGFILDQALPKSNESMINYIFQNIHFEIWDPYRLFKAIILNFISCFKFSLQFFEYNGNSHCREVVKICKSKEIILFIIFDTTFGFIFLISLDNILN